MVTYGTFKKWLHTASNGDTNARNWASGQLLKLRADDPERYREYTDKVRDETRGQNIVQSVGW